MEAQRKVYAKVPYPISTSFWGWSQVERIVKCKVIKEGEKVVEVSFVHGEDELTRIIPREDILEEIIEDEAQVKKLE